ncbi:MAG: 1,4-dihydroxy-6-naphthoate synthase [Thermus sp.]|uniref:menaquinone biosynthesis family protein n=1 Tax=unclassified Thermus TaxID=2619321 RepID=UPI0002389F4C|nr:MULTISPECIES: 1,4-dihydroxy-6-naphthoate synthase [unclassified Thermus]AEV15556.1 Menaquinone biosynthetic enzyme [Thermus sp. CCB_US3_UF1]MCS6868587.1 1,4-dihydroxy-6-naphthoate synthase [Thermus sp.]MCS7218444.1 1,4-dihydroxy-6-naphthoate synthase [Thermus sp.]MCX7849232.1 1,4-dihydroxy-6-naphthoate synthase [Thermus sp.]MDW8016800.1 1,4-dihydroxy-6-naphthoate synthase [Thermus sp.]
MEALALGYSPCPNDTFIFYALTHGRVESPLPIQPVLEDVETLNRWALEGRLPLTKLSYAAYGRVRDRYVALRSGGALGRGVGPLVVARRPLESLEGVRVAIPGRNTTAFLLLSLYAQGFQPLEVRYDQVMPLVAQGEVEAGLIIHESRFTYPQYGLVKVLDLGEWWEAWTGLPLPLGGILARRDLGEERIRALDQAVRRSLEYALAHPEETLPYLKAHAQEMAEEVLWAHVRTYVNAFSLDLGEEGEEAVRRLLAEAEARGLLPPSAAPLFL